MRIHSFTISKKRTISVQVSEVIWQQVTPPIATTHVQQSGFTLHVLLLFAAANAQRPRRTGARSHREVCYDGPVHDPLESAHS